MGDQQQVEVTETTSAEYTSRYSTYKKLVTSTEVSFASQTATSTYERELMSEFTSSAGITSSTKEIITGTDVRGLPVYIAIQDFTPEAGDRDSMPLEAGQIVEVLDNKNPNSWLVRTKARPARTGWVPGSYFETPADYYKQRRRTREIEGVSMTMTEQEEAIMKRDQVYAELLRSEEQFVSELRHIIEFYVPCFEAGSTPMEIRHLKDQIVMNLKELYNFHANVLLKGLQYYSDDPSKVGQTFLRLERDFDHHVRYCRDEPNAEKLLQDEKVKKFFDSVSARVETGDMKLVDYLRNTRERLQYYQQYFKEFIKYAYRADQSTKTLQRALELMLSVPQRAHDLSYIRNIQASPVDPVKLGRLIRHEQFIVWENNKSGEGKLRYLFLFKSRIILTELVEPEDPEDLPEFKHIATVRLDRYDVNESPADPGIFIMAPTDLTSALSSFYLQPADAQAAEFARQAWLKDIVEMKEAIVAEGSDMDTETGTDFIDMTDVRSEFSEYSTTGTTPSGTRKSSRVGADAAGTGPDEGPPRKKTKSPPAISPSGSSVSLYSGSSGDFASSAGGTTLDMQGTKVTRTQYGFRTLQESTAKMCLKVTGYPLPKITWFKDDQQLQEDERHKFYADDEGFFALTIDPVKVEDTGHYSCVASNEYGQATTSAFFRVIKVEKETCKPVFLSTLEDVEIGEGETATFETEVDGWPEPELTWLVDGQIIHPSADFRIEYDGQKTRLVIRDAQVDDTGTYSARITNDQGQAEIKAKLIVAADPDKNKVAPEFQQRIEDYECWEGDTVKFKAVCTGDPVPDYVWLCNGVPMTESDKVKFISEDGIYMVIISDVTKHFEGDITLQVSNRLGEANCHANLIVRAKETPPKFERELKDQSVKKGKNATFECEVSGHTEPEVVWVVNGNPVNKDTRGIQIQKNGPVHRLIMENVSPLDACDVVAKASNKMGTAESQAKLVVVQTEGPKFKEGLKDVTVSDTDPAEFTVKISADEPFEVTWTVDGKPVTEADGCKLFSTGDGEYSLKVPPNLLKDGAKVVCQAKNEDGKAESQATVTVKPSTEAPKITKTLSPIEAVEGDQVTATVAASGKPLPTFTWTLGGKPLKDGVDGVQIKAADGSSSLTIPKAKLEHAGELKCVAENSAGKAETAAPLQVKESTEAPKITKALSPIEAADGDQVIATVTASGKPTPTFTWTLGGKQLKDGVDGVQIKASDSSSTITIPNIKTDSAGELKCVAENSAGKADTNAPVKVSKKVVPPQFTSKPGNEAVSTGDPIEFDAVVTGDPMPEVEWFLNGKPLGTKEASITFKDGKAVLKIASAKLEHTGDITCKATNPGGAAECRAKLTVQEKQEAPKFVKEVNEQMCNEGDTASWDVKVTGIPTPTVHFYLNGKELTSANPKVKIQSDEAQGTHKITLSDIRPDHAGTLECQAENSAGVAKCWASVGVTKKKMHTKPQFQSNLSPINLTEGDTLRTKVLISGDPPPQVKWYINDQLVVKTDDTDLIAEDGVYILEIRGASTPMTGKLRCVAFNKMGEVEQTTDITVINPIPVEFEQSLSDATCREGDTLKLKAVLLGEPMPDVTWYVNGKQLKESSKIKIQADRGTYTVVIKDITCDYSGTVLCKAINEFGEASSSAKLLVLPRGEPPDFTEWMSNVSVREGGTVTHRVVYTGNPTPVIRWWINDLEVRDGDKGIAIKTVGNVCTLTITGFSGKHVGEVICQAENDAGEVSCTANQSIAEESSISSQAMAEDMEVDDAATEGDDDITMEEDRAPTPVPAPKFITKLRDVKVKKGQKAVFECAVPDTKGIVVKWLKDGNEIELVTRIRVKSSPKGDHLVQELVIDNVELDDAGRYECHISNEAGQEISAAQLDVLTLNAPPKVNRGLTDVSVNEHQVARFECEIKGEPNPEITWFKADVQLKESAKCKMENREDGTRILIITDALLSDIAKYKVVAKNSEGSVQSEANLTVKAAPQLTKPLSDVTVKETETATFECSATGEAKATWKKNGAALKIDGKRIKAETSGEIYRLIITDSVMEDMAAYTCELENAAGKISSDAKLTVQASASAPTVSKPLTDVTVVENETATFECSVTSKPTATASWLKNGAAVKIDGKRVTAEVKGDIYRLIIANTTMDDMASYACELTNTAGKVKSEAKLTVKAGSSAPNVYKPLTDVTVTEKEKATFECSASAKPAATAEWTKDGTALVIDGKRIKTEVVGEVYKLTIAESTMQDVASYECVLTNEAGQMKSKAKLTVQASATAPTFTKPLSDVTVNEKETATFECSSSAKPAATAAWSKAGAALTPDGKRIKAEVVGDIYKLTIAETTMQDVASYACELTNEAGKAKSEAKLTVKAATAPTFTKPLSDVIVNEKETATFECSSSSKPAATAAWSKNGAALTPDGKRIKAEVVGEVCKLTIAESTMQDVASYACELTNEAGKAKSEAKLTVKATATGPTFTKPLADVTVNEKETAIFECSSSAKPAATAAWSKNGAALTPDGKRIKAEVVGEVYKLTIAESTMQDVASYACELTNEAGKAKSEAKLTVKAATSTPTFSKPLADVTVNEKETATFECSASAKPAPTAAWFKNGAALTIDGKRIKAEVAGEVFKLIVADAVKEDMATYACELTNEAGKAKSEAKLTVKESAAETVPETKTDAAVTQQAASEPLAGTQPSVVKPLTDICVEVSKTATFECSATAEPQPTASWLKNGAALKTDDGQRIATEATAETYKLIINKCTLDDQGSYSCVLTNEVGTVKTDAKLTVKSVEKPKEKGTKPGFDSALKDVSVKEGETATFECKITGEPIPDATWYLNGTEIKIDKTRISTSIENNILKLVIKDCKLSDVGEYKVKLTNAVGSAECKANLAVAEATEPPKFTKELTKLSVDETETASLECTVTGKPTPAIEWEKDGKAVVADGNRITAGFKPESGACTLVIKEVKKEDLGTYKCKAVNTAGQAATQNEVEVQVLVAPEFTTKLEPTEVAEGQEHVELQCTLKADARPKPEIQWSRDGKPVKPDGKHMIVEQLDNGNIKLIIDVVKSEDVGVYKCEAVNKKGKVATEAELKFAKIEELPVEQAPEFTQPLSQSAVVVGADTQMECAVKGLENGGQVKWLKDGKEVKPEKDHIEIIAKPDGTQTLIIHSAQQDDVGKYECIAVNTAGEAKTDAPLQLQQAPEFIKQLEPVTAELGASTVLECAVKGDPAPEIKWSKDGQPVKSDADHKIESLPDGTQRLILSKAVENDAGSYKCEAISPVGSAFTEGALQLKVAAQVTETVMERLAPQFTKVLHAAEAPVDGTVELICCVTGMPRPEVKWLHDGKEVKPDGKRIKVEDQPDGTQKLIIKNADIQTIGEYRCEAMNVVGTAWTEAPVTVASSEELPVAEGVAPDFAEPLHSAQAVVGETVTLVGKVTGDPAPDIRWFKGEQELKPDGKHIKAESNPDGTQRLILAKTTEADAGEYRCEASNASGVTWSDATVGVKEPEIAPSFIKELEATSVEEGQEVTFVCQVKGYPSPEVKWYKDGHEMGSKDGIRVIEAFSDGTHKLTIPATKAEHQGNYKAEATNSAGSCSCRAPLTVTVPEEPPKVSKKLEPVKTTEGNEVVLECAFSGNVDTVKWLKNGKPITASDKVKIETKPDGTQRLILPAATVTDTGFYSCVASNSGGDAKTDADVAVSRAVKAPAFADGGQLKEQTVDQGATATFTCKVVIEGGIPTIAWLKNGKQLTADKKVVMTVDEKTGVCTLKINDSQPDDATKYTVQLKNPGGEAESTAALTVKLLPPKVLKGLEDKTVEIGEEVKFVIEFSGIVETIKWFKSGNQLAPDGARLKADKLSETKYQLTFSKAELTDAGEIKVCLENKGGKVESTAKLVVNKPAVNKPRITGKLKDQTVKVGETCKFNVTCAGDPPTKVVWMQGDKPLEASDKIKIDKIDDFNYRLTISDCQMDDAATYSVKLSNEGGSEEEFAILTVQLPPPPKPQILKGLEDQTVVEGNDCMMEVEINTKPKTIKWYKNGFELRPSNRVKPEKLSDTKYRLEIAQAVADDDATYKVVLENESGSVESLAKLTVQLPPEPSLVIKKDLMDQKITEGREAAFTVEVKGKPGMVKWYKNGQLISPSNRLRLDAVPDAGRYTLVIPKCEKSDEGTYRVELSDADLTVQSAADLSVRIPEVVKEPDTPPVFVIPLKTVTANEGQDCVLEVKVRGSPKPDIKWLYKGQSLPADERYQIEDMSDGRWRLTIKNTKDTDAGQYTCVASNTVGTEQSVGAVTIKPAREKRKPEEERYKPRFNVLLRDRRILEGAMTSIECYVDAKPRATIEWFKDGAAISTDDHIRIEYGADGRCSLFFDKFTPEDVGSYRCVATNELGKAETNCNIRLETPKIEEPEKRKEYPPKFTVEPENQKATIGQDVVIECYVFGYPEPIITWFKDGVPVKLDSRTKAEYNPSTGMCRLLIGKATAADSGAYRVVASNIHGSANAACNLTIAAAKEAAKKDGAEPYFTKGLVDSWFEKSEDLIYRCTVTGSEPLEIKWYKDGTLLRSTGRYKLDHDSDGTCTLTIRDCAFSDEGIYRCEAHNKFGSAKTQGTGHVDATRGVRKLEVTSGEAPNFIIPLEDITRLVGSTIELDCKVTGNPTPQIKWSKDGAPLRPDSRISVQPGVETGRFTLTIRDARTSDEGTYRCVANNDSGSATTKSFVRLDSGAASTTPLGRGPSAGAKFTVPLGDVRTNEGRPLTLECKLGGEPMPTVAWFKDGEKLEAGPERTIEVLPDGTCRLHVPSAQKSDAGMYRVIATNPDGTAQMKCNVTIKPAIGGIPSATEPAERDFGTGRAPRVTTSLETTKAREGGTLILTCRFVGSKTLKPAWFKDGERLYPFARTTMVEHGEGDFELKIIDLTKLDYGCYRCVCENDFGSARSSCEVVIEPKREKAAFDLEKDLRDGNAPGFSVPLTVRRMREGGCVIYECTAYGKPFPNIKWLKDGVEVQNGARFQISDGPYGQQKLMITDLQMGDEGLVRCVATNPFGTTSTKAELIVERDPERAKKPKMDTEIMPPRAKRPHFRQPLRNITVPQGGVAEFVIAVAGHPTATVKWLLNGKPLSPSEKVMMFTDEYGLHHLVFIDCQTADQGEISCAAENEMGTSRSDGSLSVLKSRGDAGDSLQNGDIGDRAPMFLKLLRGKNTFTGVPIVLDCRVIGSPVPSVTWYKDGKKIQTDSRVKLQALGDENHILIITTATEEDSGEYVCVAENTVGSARTMCKIDVMSPSWDMRDGGDEVGRYAGDWMFTKTLYQGIPHPPDRGPFIADASGHYLTLSWIPTKRIPPRYEQITYVIEIRELPYPEWEVLDYNIPEPVCKVRNLELGKSYQFRVRAENIYGISEPSPASPPSKLMSKPQQVLDSNRRPIPLVDPWMEKAQNKTYAEQYACAPWFAPREKDNFFCAVNESIEVVSHVSGYPDPKITWLHKGQEIDTKPVTSRVKTTVLGGTQCILSVRGFQLQDGGQYTCVASNDYGEAQQSFWIGKADRPRFTDQLHASSCVIGKVVSMKARVEGNPSPDVKWVKDWHPITESTRLKMGRDGMNVVHLTINDAILRDTGIYSCIATNEAGRASTSSTLTVLAMPVDDEVPVTEEIPRRKVVPTPRVVREVFEMEDELVT